MQQRTPFYTAEIHIIRLGNIAIASNPFELYTDYGLRMKALSRADQTFIVQLACDAGRYLPTERIIRGALTVLMCQTAKLALKEVRFSWSGQ